jgi:hypothetical protein
MGSLDAATPGKALVLGALLSGVIRRIRAGRSCRGVGGRSPGLRHRARRGRGVFVLVGSVTIVGAVVVSFVGGRWGVSLLDDLREFMVANNAVITVFVLLILGAKVLGGGPIGLGR